MKKNRSFLKDKYDVSVLIVVIIFFGISMYGIYLFKLSQVFHIKITGTLKDSEEVNRPVEKAKSKKQYPSYILEEEPQQELINPGAYKITPQIETNENDENTQAEEEVLDEEIQDTNSGTNNSCPISTQNCIACYKDEAYCRLEEGEDYGYLGWACQNNNPGNVKYSEYRVSLIEQMGGTPPCGQKGGFMVFSDYPTGRKSVKAYIRAINVGKHVAYPECGDCSLLYFFEKYAANSLYAYKIEETMGGTVTVNTKLSWIVQNRFDDFINAIQYREGWFIE